jgi:hypothetical protein
MMLIYQFEVSFLLASIEYRLLLGKEVDVEKVVMKIDELMISGCFAAVKKMKFMEITSG